MMRIICFFAFYLTISCTYSAETDSASKFNFAQLEKIDLKTTKEIEGHFGSPTEKSEVIVGEKKYSSWKYRNVNKRLQAEFLIEDGTNVIVEMTTFPDTSSPDRQLQFITNNYFKGQKVDRMPIKCSHHGEQLIYNLSNGYFIFTREESNAPVLLAGISKVSLLDEKIKLNKARVCKR